MKFRDVLNLLFGVALCYYGVPQAFAQQNSTTPSSTPGTNAQAPLAASLEAIASDVETERKAQGVPGLALVIVKDDRVILSRGFGVRDVEKSLPVTPDTLFQIGSTTKAFTSMLAEMSVDDHKLSIDDAPKRFLPYFKMLDPLADANITLRDLMCHRSGLKRTDLSWITGALDREDAIRVMGQTKATSHFRSRFQYNNNGYSAVGEAVAQAQHTSWEDLVADRIFTPLGMSETTTSLEKMLASPDYSSTYALNSRTKAPIKLEAADAFNIPAAGAIKSNAKDMARWLRFMLNQGVADGNRLVSQRGYDELLSYQMKISDKQNYGLGWFLEQWHGHRVVEHGGAILGFRTKVAFMPDQHIGFVLLANVRSEALQTDIDAMIWTRLVTAPNDNAEDTTPKTAAPEADASPTIETGTQESEGPELAPSTATEAQLQELAGTYQQLRGGIAEIILRRGVESLIVSNGNTNQLILKGKNQFALSGLSSGFLLSILRDRQGRVVGLYLKQPQGDVAFRRLPDFVPPLSVEELMAKVVEAAGGEAALRQHPMRVTNFKANFENEGVTAQGTFKSKEPTSVLTHLELMAVGKPIGTVNEHFQDFAGAVETYWDKKHFPMTINPVYNLIADWRVVQDEEQLLDWKTVFKSVTIKRLDHIGGEDVFEVEKVPVKGTPVTDYISTDSFHVLKRESPVSGWVHGNETYSDYRVVDGIAVPYHIEVQTPALGHILIDVRSVRFDENLTAADFGPQKP